MADSTIVFVVVAGAVVLFVSGLVRVEVVAAVKCTHDAGPPFRRRVR